MILNAVALFFMLELDDFMVTAQDYHDCENHLQLVLSMYNPDTSINRVYDPNYPQISMNEWICCCNDRNHDLETQKQKTKINPGELV